MTALYLLADEYRAATEKLADMDLDEATIADTLESLSGDLDVKARNVAAFARNLETTAAAIKEAEASMAARRKAIENRAAGLRRYLLESMQHAGISKIECAQFALTIKKNPLSVDVFDVAQVPDGLLRKSLAVEITDAFEVIPNDKDGLDWLTVSGPREKFNFTEAPAKDAIKAAIKAGIDVPGARLVQHTRLEVA